MKLHPIMIKSLLSSILKHVTVGYGIKTFGLPPNSIILELISPKALATYKYIKIKKIKTYLQLIFQVIFYKEFESLNYFH